MQKNITTQLLMHGSTVPGFGRISLLGLKIQELCWGKYPQLTEKLSNFLPIGGLCSIIQILLLAGLKAQGSSTLTATIIAVIAGTSTNYLLNAKITWSDRFVGLTRKQKWAWAIPLYLVFLIGTVANYLKIVGVPALESIGVPAVAGLIALEIVGTVLNFIGTDKLTFGLMTLVIRRLARS